METQQYEIKMLGGRGAGSTGGRWGQLPSVMYSFTGSPGQPAEHNFQALVEG